MPQKNGETETQETAFKIVGVGASAAGVEALSEFLTGLSATPGMAFLLVLQFGQDRRGRGVVRRRRRFGWKRAPQKLHVADRELVDLQPAT